MVVVFVVHYCLNIGDSNLWLPGSWSLHR